MTSKILIIIVTWNKKDYVLELLSSIRGLQYQQDALDIVVVDNASNDGTVEAIKTAHPHVTLLCNEENLGGTGGFNTGLSWAFEQPEGQYDYLWLLDNDVLVHQNALQPLINILENNADVAAAGSTMMQLDYPWRINEIGSFVDLSSGALALNRHFEEIPTWMGEDVQDLLKKDVDLSQLLSHCSPVVDVDYVAAASLLIRADVAKEAGIWKDYFIHFDDVEWCLRLRQMGHRVVASTRSLIWHLSAAAKVATWILYYDNRNILSLLETHTNNPAIIKNATYQILKRGLRYALLGKADISVLHKLAVDDYYAKRFGKKDIKLSAPYKPTNELSDVLRNPKIKRILISHAVDLQAVEIQNSLSKLLIQRPDLEIDFVVPPKTAPVFQLPRNRFIHLVNNRVKRIWQYWKMRGQYDLVIQSDYHSIIGLSWLDTPLIFINNEGFCSYPTPKLQPVKRAARWLIEARLGMRY